MKLIANPTSEIFNCPLVDSIVTLRVWDGITSEGVPVDLYVFAIVAKEESDTPKLAEELPDYMKPSREINQIDFKQG